MYTPIHTGPNLCPTSSDVKLACSLYWSCFSLFLGSVLQTGGGSSLGRIAARCQHFKGLTVFPGHSLVQFFADWRCEWLGKEAKWELMCKELVDILVRT